MTEKPAQEAKTAEPARLEEDGEHDDHFPARPIFFRLLEVVVLHRRLLSRSAASPSLAATARAWLEKHPCSQTQIVKVIGFHHFCRCRSAAEFPSIGGRLKKITQRGCFGRVGAANKIRASAATLSRDVIVRGSTERPIRRS